MNSQTILEHIMLTPLYQLTLAQAQQFCNRTIDNADRILKRPSWTANMQKYWNHCWGMIERHKLAEQRHLTVELQEARRRREETKAQLMRLGYAAKNNLTVTEAKEALELV